MRSYSVEILRTLIQELEPLNSLKYKSGAGATNYLLQIPPIISFRFHQLLGVYHSAWIIHWYFRTYYLKKYSAGATNWFLQEPPIGFCRSHQLVASDSTNSTTSREYFEWRIFLLILQKSPAHHDGTYCHHGVMQGHHPWWCPCQKLGGREGLVAQGRGSWLGAQGWGFCSVCVNYLILLNNWRRTKLVNFMFSYFV